MSDLQAFFAENVESNVTTKVVISKRFKDKEGKPVKWEIKAIGEDENTALRKSATKKVKVRNGVYMPETDHDTYIVKLVGACVVFPNLKDANLQKSYDVMGAEELVKKMLLPGEYGELVQEIQKLNGFDIEMEDEVEAVKN